MTDLQRFAAADWAFIKDSSALAIVEGDETQLKLICMYEWRGSDKRDPRLVVPEAAALCKKYGVESVMSDRYYEAFVVNELADEDIGWIAAPITQEEIAQSYLKLRMLVHSGAFVLNGSSQVKTHLARLKQQLKSVKSKPTAAGGLHIELSSKDGSHSDLVAAVVLAAWQAPTVAQDGTMLRLRSRIAAFDNRYTESTPAFFENSQDYEDFGDERADEAEPLIAIG